MATKQEIINSLVKTGYGREEVRGLINSLSSDIVAPKKLRKGDLYIDMVGVKNRPCVIVKIVGGMVTSIPLTTTEDALAMIPHNSRFAKEGFFTRTLAFATEEHAKTHFKGVFDDPKNLNRALRVIKSHILKLI